MMNNKMRGFWVIVTALVLLIAASRFTRLNHHTMNRDEVWSVWQTLGTPEQIIQWTPYDWPPLYYLVLGTWHNFVGMMPLALRALSALMFPLGAAFLFRVMRRWRGPHAAVLTALAYSALGFSIQLSMEVRGYSLLLALFPAALWFVLRYFDRPGFKRALPLALVLAAMFYTSLTSVAAFIMLGLFTAVVYRHRIWRWWLPGLLAGGLAVPEIISKAQIATSRVSTFQTLSTPPLPQALLQLFMDYTGFTFFVWGVLFVAALVLIVNRERRLKAYVPALILWTIGMPLVLYILNPRLSFFSSRYAWWILPGIALLVGWGLSYLSRAGRAAAGIMLSVLMFAPLPQDGQYQIWDTLSPLGDNFAWLHKNMQWGDVILNNAQHTCGQFEEWDYYRRAYFPNGLRFVNSPGTYRRLWVLNPSDLPEDVYKNLSTYYMRGRFVGPPGCLFRLYEAPPDTAGTAFQNGMRFHGVDVIENGDPVSGPLVRHEGESVRFRLWWSADSQLPLDYSVGTTLRRGPIIVDQFDGPPQLISPIDSPLETSRWQTGLYYVEERELKLPFPASGNYLIDLVVYFWADALPIPATGVNNEGRFPLVRVQVRSY